MAIVEHLKAWQEAMKKPSAGADEQGQGKESECAYGSGWELATELKSAISSSGIIDEETEKAIYLTKESIDVLYRDGDEVLRRCIVDSVLEHVLEDPRLRPYFEDWAQDPILKQPFDEAIEWAEHVSRIRTFLKSLEPKILPALEAQIGQQARICRDDLGSTVLAFEWEEESSLTCERLAVECSDDLAKAILARREFSENGIERAATYVLDARNWRQSEFLEEEWWVTIPLSVTAPKSC